MKDQALQIVKTLRAAGHQAVFAGGFVRDMIMGLESHDIDVATSCPIEDVEKLFDKTVPVGKAFGVIIVVLDGVETEVATFRQDVGFRDGRHPDKVVFTTMEEDAQRRDLTINGLFYDPIEDRIYDYVGGKKDIEDKIVRLIGDAEERIIEDRLRMMRVVRFAARFGFTVEPETLATVTKYAAKIKEVSPERIGEELLKILHGRNFKVAFDLLFETKLIDYILPEIKAMEGCAQPVDYHPEGARVRKILDS